MDLILKEPFLSCFEYVADRIGKDKIYLVGGFIRDALLGKKTKDMDFCCPLDGEKIHSLFKDGLYFEKFGTVSFSYQDIQVTIASLRKEGNYTDYRHPAYVEFVKTIEEDFKRRDFSINSLYLDSDFRILDPSSFGIKDISNKEIRILGNPFIRLKEDPLRIVRAYRFSLDLNFTLQGETKEAIKDCLPLLRFLNPKKIQEEINKCGQKEKLESLLFPS